MLPLAAMVKKDPIVIELLGFKAKFDYMSHTTAILTWMECSVHPVTTIVLLRCKIQAVS